MSRCYGIGEDVWPYHQSGCCGRQIIGPVDSLASSTCPTEDNNCLHPAIPVDRSRRRVVDYPVTGEVPVMIVGVIFYLVNDHGWHEELSIRSVEDQISTPEGRSLSYLIFPDIK